MISIDLIRYFLGVGGAAALGMLTLAYKDPAFYLSYIEKVITIIVGIIFSPHVELMQRHHYLMTI